MAATGEVLKKTKNKKEWYHQFNVIQPIDGTQVFFFSMLFLFFLKNKNIDTRARVVCVVIFSTIFGGELIGGDQLR